MNASSRHATSAGKPSPVISALLISILALGFSVGTGSLNAGFEPAVVLSPPKHVLDTGLQAPLIRYNRNLSGGSHTHGAWNGGWQITHALGVLSGADRRDRGRMLDQIRYSLEGTNAITATGGHPAQHERNITGAYTILRHAAPFWNDVLSEEERNKITLLMKAALVASAYTTADKTYAGGRAPTGLDGGTNLNRGWNPNFREGMFGGLIHATVFFGGVEAVTEILDNYDHAAFVAELDAAGLTNPHETFTWAESNPGSGAPTGGQIEEHIRDYRYHGEPLMDPMQQLYALTVNTYGATVRCGLNNGAGILENGIPTGTIASGCSGLPNLGKRGMLREFDSSDASGARSSITYSYDGFRPNLANHTVVLIGGYWEPGDRADEIVELLDIGITDLRYKLEHGYRNYSHGSGSTTVFDIDRDDWSWSFRTTLPLWEEMIREYHLGESTPPADDPFSYSWFGSYDEGSFSPQQPEGWANHGDHGWIYLAGAGESAFWFWDFDIGWIWTSASEYPYLYSNTRNAWIWYYVGSSNPRWFVDPQDPDNPFRDDA